VRVRRALVLCVLLAGCARTGLLEGETDDGSAGSGGTTLPECRTSADCAVTDPCAPPRCISLGDGGEPDFRCVPEPVACDDLDECTVDRCDPESGACRHEPPPDADGDGFRAEPAGEIPVRCGPWDCDDADANVRPGAGEVCDGRDNDCNDAIDEGFDYTNVEVAPVPIAPAERGRATRGGLAWSGTAYGVTYNTTGRKQSYFKLLTTAGLDASAEVEVSHINADAYAGPVEWSGTSFFTAFADARQAANYEIYSARFRGDGLKIQDSEVRLTDAPDFSLNPAVLFTGDEYVVAWDDRRGRATGGFPQVFARRFSETGEPIGGEALVSAPGEWGEYPALALGERTLGLTYLTLGEGGVAESRFVALGRELDDAAAPVTLPGSRYANAPAIAFAAGRYVVAWGFVFEQSVPGAAIHLASVEEATNAVAGGHAATFGFSFARAPALVSLGDRAFLVFSGAGADGAYELHSVTVPPTLRTAAATQLTSTPALSLFPYAARGPGGSIGIVFDENVETGMTSRRPYFMSVGCRSFFAR
jgi:hypothetical protein